MCIYQDLRNPLQWRRPWAEHYQTALAQVEHAEELGLDGVFFTEHHFFEDGYLPQPAVYGAAVAARTTRMTIGTSISIAPFRPAVDHAEQAAMVDVISNGRFELGLGVGYRLPEFKAFGADPSNRFAKFEALINEVRHLLADGVARPRRSRTRSRSGPVSSVRAAPASRGAPIAASCGSMPPCSSRITRACVRAA